MYFYCTGCFSLLNFSRHNLRDFQKKKKKKKKKREEKKKKKKRKKKKKKAK